MNSLFNKPLWKYFKQLSDIPRESGNESGVRQFILSWAKEHDLEALVDKAGNVIVKAPATAGMEHVEPLALQGHMDMVCVRGENSSHDFTKDPISLVVDGDILSADDTTLGADNGIAVALIMDLLSDRSASHGPLEAIFTVEEETGLTGAFELDGSLIDSRRMLNIDSEEEGIFFIGCAGGNEVDGKLRIERQPLSDHSVVYDVELSGLLGGHSGGEIHTQRGNAIKLLTRFLYSISEQSPVRIVSIQGGTKRNVIPSSCRATVAVSDSLQMKDAVSSFVQIISNEYRTIEKSISLTADRSEKQDVKAMSSEDSKTLISALMLAPHGVQRMSGNIKGLVETSANLAIISTGEDTISLVSSHRSEIASARDAIAQITALAFQVANAETVIGNSYPAWTPNPESPLARFCARSYKEMTGKDAEITAIHAGLECGIINDRVKGMDSVSFGPDIWDAHSIKERVSISSTERMAAFLRRLCTIIGQ
ncbi:MAG: aminoacyl-histidine dipeptidase [Sphaerochaetaceae bacterium]|nr:aminoacyl-histidine dipeptidase [Sphaerochaetaceae bacterium]